MFFDKKFLDGSLKPMFAGFYIKMKIEVLDRLSPRSLWAIFIKGNREVCFISDPGNGLEMVGANGPVRGPHPIRVSGKSVKDDSSPVRGPRPMRVSARHGSSCGVQPGSA